MLSGKCCESACNLKINTIQYKHDVRKMMGQTHKIYLCRSPLSPTKKNKQKKKKKKPLKYLFLNFFCFKSNIS